MTWEELKGFARANNVRQAEIAKKLDTSLSTVCHWFNEIDVRRESEVKRKKVEETILQIISERGAEPIQIVSPAQMPMPTMVSLNVARVNGLLKKHGFTWQNLAFLVGNENFTETNLTTDNTISQKVIEKLANIFKVSASELCISDEKRKLDMYTKMDARLDELKVIATVLEAKINSLNEKFLNLAKVITNMEDAVIETYKFMKESKGGINEKN